MQTTSFPFQTQNLQERAATALKENPELRVDIQLQAVRIRQLERELAESKRQEELTHDALHDWRDAAQGQHAALQMIPILVKQELEKGHTPLEVLDTLNAHADRYTKQVLHSKFSQSAT